MDSIFKYWTIILLHCIWKSLNYYWCTCKYFTSTVGRKGPRQAFARNGHFWTENRFQPNSSGDLKKVSQCHSNKHDSNGPFSLAAHDQQKIVPEECNHGWQLTWVKSWQWPQQFQIENMEIFRLIQLNCLLVISVVEKFIYHKKRFHGKTMTSMITNTSHCPIPHLSLQSINLLRHSGSIYLYLLSL